MGAGILPIAIQNGKIYLLFGEERIREHETAIGWADFGGGRSYNGESNANMAIREFTEETSGFFGNRSDVKKLMNKKKWF
jgi:hypothetical protein